MSLLKKKESVPRAKAQALGKAGSVPRAMCREQTALYREDPALGRGADSGSVLNFLFNFVQVGLY
jgi:hypothetical protein